MIVDSASLAVFNLDVIHQVYNTAVGDDVKIHAGGLHREHQRISVKTVQWLVYKYLELAGLESKHYSVHKLRHTAATLMYQTGEVDVRVLKDILGHEQLNTTQIYTHVSDVNMMNAMGETPLSNLTSTKADKNTEDQ